MTESGARTHEFLTVPELAALLRIKERKVYDLAASGEVPCSRVTGKLLFPEPAVRAWIAHGSFGGATRRSRPAVFLGSHDPLLDWAVRQSRSGFATLFDGSLDGLARFHTGEGVATGLHLHDAASGGWNLPAAAARFAGEDVVLVAWASRRRGLVLRPEASDVADIADLAGRRVVPRQPESGAQALFEHVVAEAGLTDGQIDFTPPARSEADAVLAVAQGTADVAFGLEALARPYGLRFVPILDEPFDLLVSRRAWFEPPMQRLLAFCATPGFREQAAGLAGYDVSEIGHVRWNA